jgi:hypothetical protein
MNFKVNCFYNIPYYHFIRINFVIQTCGLVAYHGEKIVNQVVQETQYFILKYIWIYQAENRLNFYHLKMLNEYDYNYRHFYSCNNSRQSNITCTGTF